MFYCYVLLSQKTGRRYVGSCENLTERIRRHNAGDSKATNTECLGCCSTVRASILVPVQRNVSDITRLGEEGMSWTKTCRVVAAATGRRFKSSRPDVAAHIGKFGYIRRKQR